MGSCDPIVIVALTGSSNINVLCFPDDIEIVSLPGIMLWCQEINQ